MEDQTEGMEDLLAGYNHTRGEMPPVEDQGQEAVIEKDPVEEVVDPIEKMKAELEAFKSEVKSMQGDPQEVRKLYGEIGNINRTIQQMQAPAAKSDPVGVAAALAEAEALADEYPEIAGPMITALKVLQERKEPEDVSERIKTEVAEIRRKDAMEALTDEHPDWQEFRNTDGFRDWLKSKPLAFQQRYNNTWNPATVSKGLTEAKEFVAAKQNSKTAKLERGITPRGVPHTGKPSTLPDEQGLWNGYNKGKRPQL